MRRNATSYLVDLAAWANFNRLSFSAELGINRINTLADAIVADKLYTLKSADFFLNLAGITDGPVFSLLNSISARESLLLASSTYPDCGILVSEAIGDCPVMAKYYAMDCSKIYSLVQYIELLFYIEMVVVRQEYIKSIKFILPNDEYKYYPDLTQLEVDVSNFLQLRLGYTGNLDLQILCFQYSKRMSNRPYLNTSKGVYTEDDSFNLDCVVDLENVLTPKIGGCK